MRRPPNNQHSDQHPVTSGGQATLVWSCWDNSKTVTSLVHEALHRWAIGSGVQVQPQSTAVPLSSSQSLGLAIWAGWETREFDSICQSIMKLRDTHPETIFVVFVAESCREQASRIVQSGAHLVLHSLSNLQVTIAKIANAIPLCYQDTNRLTQGIMPGWNGGT